MAYEAARELENVGEHHARAAEGLLRLFRDADLETSIEEMVDLASAHPEDVAVQIAAADLLDAHGEQLTATQLLETVAQGNAMDFSLRRALLERNIDFDPPETHSESAPGHGEGLP